MERPRRVACGRDSSATGRLTPQEIVDAAIWSVRRISQGLKVFNATSELRYQLRHGGTRSLRNMADYPDSLYGHTKKGVVIARELLGAKLDDFKAAVRKSADRERAVRRRG